jgi:hypothetical protein
MEVVEKIVLDLPPAGMFHRKYSSFVVDVI